MTEYRELPAYAGYFIGDDGSIVGRSGRIIKANPDGNGYTQINACLPGNRRKSIKIHALVCEAFHGPAPSPLHTVAHGDGNRANNCAHNLRWATRQENERDKANHGTRLTGERHFAARLTEPIVREMRQRATAGEKYRALAQEFGVSKATARTAILGLTWGHVQ